MMILFLLVAVAAAREFTDEEISRLPRLYHLDDYKSCLSKPEGLYCLATFQILPGRYSNSTVYDLIRKYSSDKKHFDRRLLHRGWCVSDRCYITPSQPNTSRTLQQCARVFGRQHSFNLRLQTLHYCHTQADAQEDKEGDSWGVLFLSVVGVILCCNVIGTAYDVVLEDDVKKNVWLTSWSVRSNWHRLTARYEDGDPRLTDLLPVQGVRVLIILLVMLVHSGMINNMLYLYNPRDLEQTTQHPLFTLLRNGTCVVQVFLMLSSFLFAYNLLLYNKTTPVSMAALPTCILNRVIRVSPVYLLAVGYAATWWPHISNGPLWPLVVGAESDICQHKFWTHALFVNNLVEPDKHCMIQTWFLAVDMQLYILCAVLSLWLVRRPGAALPVLAALFVASCLLNALLAYIYDWKSLLYVMVPETVRTVFRTEPSFWGMYTSPWASLPASLLGLFIAHLHFDLQERGFKAQDHKWLLWCYHASIPLALSWVMAGYAAQRCTARHFTVLYAALERPVFNVISAACLFGLINHFDGWVRSFFSWHVWRVAARMGLAVLVTHWTLNLTLLAATPQPLHYSKMNVLMEWSATSVFTYLIAVPLTLLVEMPLRRFLGALIT